MLPSLLTCPQSLLNKANGKWAKEMLNNVRMSCCVAGATQSVPKEVRPGPCALAEALAGGSWALRPG